MKRGYLILIVALVTACASVPIKQQVSDTHQAVRLALTAFDDAEHDLCAPAATVPHDCTNATRPAQLTSAVNQQIAAALVKAFEDDKKVSAAIIAWKAGDPKPTDLPTLLVDVQAALDVVKSFAPGGSTILAKAQAAIDEVNKLIAAFGGGL